MTNICPHCGCMEDSTRANIVAENVSLRKDLLTCQTTLDSAHRQYELLLAAYTALKARHEDMQQRIAQAMSDDA